MLRKMKARTVRVWNTIGTAILNAMTPYRSAKAKLDIAEGKIGRAVVRHDYPPGQWHRWYQTNRRRQRQLRAMKRLVGGPIDPRVANLPRWLVR